MSVTRREFVTLASAAAAAAVSCATPLRAQPRPSEFVFARLRYASGDWDYNPKVAANFLDSVLQYTSIPVYRDEVVIPADAADLPAFPFLFMTGHLLVRFSARERRGLRTFVEQGGLLFSDDCNHDVDGLYARSFEQEMRATFGPAGALPKLPATHPLYRCFFRFDTPPTTAHELNGWGDDLVHDYLRGLEQHGRLGVLYSNKDYGCEWDYDWKNKRFRREDNTKLAVNIAVYAMTS
nr:DUF4159 domain-containing protein [Luteitalea sp. TBR-22]